MSEKAGPCGGCGGPHNFDTSVPSVVWNEVIRAKGGSEYLCLTCIVREFAKVGRSFTATLYGASLDLTKIEVRVGGQVAEDAYKIQEENNALRWKVAEASDRAKAAIRGEVKMPGPNPPGSLGAALQGAEHSLEELKSAVDRPRRT